jgi:hypothetical protein
MWWRPSNHYGFRDTNYCPYSCYGCIRFSGYGAYCPLKPLTYGSCFSNLFHIVNNYFVLLPEVVILT